MIHHSYVSSQFERMVHCFMIAIDPPRNLQITPRESTYQPGDRIQCSAEGNPAPSYQWTDLDSGTVVQGAVLVITQDMVNKSHTFQCTASNQYNSVSSSSDFTVEGTTITFKLLTKCGHASTWTRIIYGTKMSNAACCPSFNCKQEYDNGHLFPL